MSNKNPQPQIEAFRRTEKLAGLISHGIVILLMVCLVWVMLPLSQLVLPDSRLEFLPWLAGLVSLEAIYTYQTTRRTSELNISRAAYWLVEWVILALLIKGFLVFWSGFDQFIAELPRLQSNFLTTFFTGETLFSYFAAGSVWLLTGLFARDLSEMEGDELLFSAGELGGTVSDRAAVRRQMVNRVWLIGEGMVILTAMIHFQVDQFGQPQSIPRSSLLVVALYFMLGFVLFGLTQLAILRARWAWEKIPVQPKLIQRWAVYSGVFLLLVVLIAMFLPTRYSLGLLTTLNYILGLALSIISFISFLLVALVLQILAFFASLVSGQEAAEAPRPTPPPFAPPPFANPSAGPDLSWWDLARSILFWVIFLSLIVYAFYQYFLQNKELVGKMRAMPFVSWLARVWDWLGRAFNSWNRQVRTVVQTRLKRLRPEGKGDAVSLRARFINLRRLSPRQRVMFFYLALLRRAGETGVPRQPSQTPFEYHHSLEPDLVENEADLQEMTEAFVEARYSLHPVSEEKASLVRMAWEHLRKALRRRRTH